MIEIKRVNNLNLAKKICAEHGVEWNPECHVIATLEGENTLNFAVFDYQNEQGNIFAIGGFNNELDLLDGLCRSILNIMDINGVKVVYLPLKYEKLAKHMGFSIENGRFQINLEGFFNCGCCHK